MNLRIVNKKKFIRSIVIVMGIGLLTLLAINTTSFSHGEIDYKTIYVGSGDTLWNIAKEEKEINAYFEGKDIRDIVSCIKTTNHLKDSDITINQKLEIPTNG